MGWQNWLKSGNVSGTGCSTVGIQSEEMAQGSERVRQRTGRLIKLVELPSVHERSQAIGDCCYGRGSYKAFLERWATMPNNGRQSVRHSSR